MSMTSHVATLDDIPQLMPLVEAAIDELQKDFLDPQQIASSHAITGIDTQLVEDGTYFVIEIDGELAGCGGWSRRATLYGADHRVGRHPEPLDRVEIPRRSGRCTRIRPFTRRGVGRMTLSLSESAAAAEGFTTLELMSTLAGKPLYEAADFRPIETTEDSREEHLFLS
jgi:hypothetical protein